MRQAGRGVRVIVSVVGACALASAASADPSVLTVGRAGGYATIQAAIDAAGTSARPVEIRVARGRYPENLSVWVASGESLTISGGWSDSFGGVPHPSPQDPAAAENTVVQGALDGPVLQASSSGVLIVRGLVLTGGGPGPSASGLDIWADDHAQVEVSESAVWDNHTVEASGRAFAHAYLVGSARMTWRGNYFTDNSHEATDAGATGGAFVYATGHSNVLLESNHFLRNTIHAPGQTYGSALSANAAQNATVDVWDNWFVDNRSSSDTHQGGPEISLFATSSYDGPGAARLTARRNQILRNVPADDAGAWQVAVTDGGTGVAVLSDSVVAGGGGDSSGILATALEGGTVYLTNLTVTGHTGAGVAVGGGAVRLDNSIVFGNGVDGPAGVTGSNNLFEDPHFVDPATDDYRLDPGSPAIDAGSNSAPEIGPWDVYQARRVQGRAVDIGAAESSDGSQGELPCAVLSPAPVGASAPICRCVSDVSLRVARCGLLDVPDLVLSWRFPLRWKPGSLLTSRWTLDPGPGVDGPFAMSAAARVDGKWLPQQWLSPAKPMLGDGKPLLTDFQLALPPDRDTYLRTGLDYVRADGTKQSVQVEVLMPRP